MTNFIKNKLLALNVKDDDKLNEYLLFCKNKNCKNHYKNQTEKHHILPKSIFPEYADLSLNVWNCTYLLYEDHYIAHSLLYEAINETKVSYAWWNMNSQNKKLFVKPEKLIGKETYKNLRESHFKIISNSNHLKNKSEETIFKRKTTLNIPDENGITGFQKQGLKISKTLKENGSMAGSNNSMFEKTIVKERFNPLIGLGVKQNYDKDKYVSRVMKYMELYDNENNLYFHGWRDECMEFCNNIGLQGFKIPAKDGFAFVYKENFPSAKYLISVMKLANLGKYLNTKVKTLSDKEAYEKYLKFNNKEAPDESIS